MKSILFIFTVFTLVFFGCTDNQEQNNLEEKKDSVLVEVLEPETEAQADQVKVVPELIGNWQLKSMMTDNTPMAEDIFGEMYYEFSDGGQLTIKSKEFDPEISKYTYEKNIIRSNSIPGEATIKELNQESLIFSIIVDGSEVVYNFEKVK